MKLAAIAILGAAFVALPAIAGDVPVSALIAAIVAGLFVVESCAKGD